MAGELESILYADNPEALNALTMIENMLPIVILFLFIGTIFSVFMAFKILKKRNKWKKKFKTGKFVPELTKIIEGRIARDGMPRKDIFSPRAVIQTRSMPITMKGEFGAYFDLFFKGTDKPVVFSEARYTFGPLIGSLDGIVVAKSMKDTIRMDIKKGVFSVYTNDKLTGTVDVAKKKIFDAENKQIGTMDYPTLYAHGLAEVNWHVYFGSTKFCSIVAALPFIKHHLSAVPHYRYDIMKVHYQMNRTQLALALAVVYLIKIKRASRPGRS